MDLQEKINYLKSEFDQISAKLDERDGKDDLSFIDCLMQPTKQTHVDI